MVLTILKELKDKTEHVSKEFQSYSLKKKKKSVQNQTETQELNDTKNKEFNE